MKKASYKLQYRQFFFPIALLTTHKHTEKRLIVRAGPYWLQRKCLAVQKSIRNLD